MNNISVVVPVYYGRRYMAEMIRQIEACCSHLDEEDRVELLFVNDAPDDPLPQKWETQSVRVIVMDTDRNVGIQAARLKGLRHCHGEYVLFLDQDDLIRPRYFQSQLLSLGKSDAVICKAVHDEKMWYSGENVFEKVVSKEFMLGMQWGWNPIASPGQVLLRKQAIPEMWKKNILTYRGADDWLLWLCMISRGCSFSLNQDVLYEHIVHRKNFSNHIVEMLQSEQEVVRIAQEKRFFSERDMLLLLDGLFKRNAMRVREQASLKKKWEILDRWMWLRERKVRLAEYLLQEGVQKIAVYGCAVLGRMVYEEIKKDIAVQYFIDRNANDFEKEISVYTLQKGLPEVDGVIITLIDQAEMVREEIKNVLDGKIIILKDWIMSYKYE